LSTSAIDTIHEHNRESPELRRTSPAVARWRSYSQDVDLSIAILNCGWQRLSRDAASREFTGQGPCRRQLPPSFGASRHDRSRTRASPQPDRLGHLLSLLATCRGWRRPYRGHSSWSARHELAEHTAKAVRLVEPPHAIPREEERVPLRPRCLPSSDQSPWRGGSPVIHKLSPACGVDPLTPFRSPYLSEPLTTESGRLEDSAASGRDQPQEPGTPR
jgi:hypothetical protein